jgi:hypothetical protein
MSKKRTAISILPPGKGEFVRAGRWRRVARADGPQYWRVLRDLEEEVGAEDFRSREDETDLNLLVRLKSHTGCHAGRRGLDEVCLDALPQGFTDNFAGCLRQSARDFLLDKFLEFRR